ncbi:MAG: AmmeMemoRadiSam system protein A [candidate division Zixibacteria bacterium]|nr:AmmeMemoRadiSam system protein A [candidate division Zixibacteria bacterium]
MPPIDPAPLTDDEKTLLLRIARDAVRKTVLPSETASWPPLEISARLALPGGAFVTLHRNGRLRGCVGQLPSARPLYEVVEQAAVGAATRDPRFARVQPDELDALSIEVSVMGAFVPLEDPAAVRIGRHGLYVRRSGFSGLLLPQVAQTYQWDAETFLIHTCEKAGLWPDAWKDPETEVFVFAAEVIEEQG